MRDSDLWTAPGKMTSHCRCWLSTSRLLGLKFFLCCLPSHLFPDLQACSILCWSVRTARGSTRGSRRARGSLARHLAGGGVGAPGVAVQGLRQRVDVAQDHHLILGTMAGLRPTWRPDQVAETPVNRGHTWDHGWEVSPGGHGAGGQDQQ